MKKNIWILAIPLVVCLVGLTGNGGLSENQPGPVSVTFSRAEAVLLCDADYIPVQIHEPFMHVALPVARNVVNPDKISGSMLEAQKSGLDQSALNSMQEMAEDRPRSMDKNQKRKTMGFMGQNKDDFSKDNQDVEKSSGRFLEEDNGGWGNGWLGESMYSEEKRAKQEFEVQVRQAESEPYSRGYQGSDPSRGYSGERSERYVERFGGPGDGARNDRYSPPKPSFRFESWKPKK